MKFLVVTPLSIYQGSTPAPDLFPHIYWFTWYDFSQYRETCEVILDYPKIGRDDVIEDYAKKAIRNLLHANIDVHIRILIAELPKYGVKCIEKLISHCVNMSFSDKSRYDRTFQQVTHKGGESAINNIKRFHSSQKMESNVLINYNHIVQIWPLLIKIDMIGLYNRLHIEEGNLQSTTLRGFKMHMLYKFQ